MNIRVLTKIINFFQWVWVRYTLGLLMLLFLVLVHQGGKI